MQRHLVPAVNEHATERLAEELDDRVRSLDASPAVFGTALKEALLQVQIGQGKTDLKDSYVIAEFARCLRRQTVSME
ncbi:hypothetical protein [Streptomyces sp. bgisy130]|uniref:hypothetical protein n=1 Tax=Streptomyces sp. bgisy130 TaxID=3413788 RepID=UPI003F4A3A69